MRPTLLCIVLLQAFAGRPFVSPRVSRSMATVAPMLGNGPPSAWSPNIPHACIPQMAYVVNSMTSHHIAMWILTLQCCLDQAATKIQQLQQVQVPAPVEFRQITKSRGCGPRSRKRTAGGQNKDERQRKQNFNRWTNGTLAAWGGTVNTPFFTKNDSHQMQDLSEVFLCSTERWGVRQRERLLTDFFCSAWGGNLALNYTFQAQQKLQIPARDLVEHMTLMPRMVNGAGIQGLRLVINAPEGSSFILPSKALVSYYRGIVDKYLDRTFNCTERDLRIKGDTFSIATPQKFLEVLFTAYDVHTINQGQHIYKIQLCIDGAPTTKHNGLVALSVRLCDPRTSEAVRAKPQSNKFCFVFGGTWNKENRDNLYDAFRDDIQEFRQLAETGVNVAGINVRFDCLYGLDKKCEWAGSGHGGPMGSVKFPDPKTPVTFLTRDTCMPFDCSRCAARSLKCCHWEFDPDRVRQKSVALMNELKGKTENDKPLDKAMPLVSLADDVFSACRVRGISLRGVSTKKAALPKLQEHCVATLAAIGGEDAEDVVENMDDARVALELRHYTAVVSTNPRAFLIYILKSVDLLRRAAQYLEFKAPSEDDLWGKDSMKVAEDLLHCCLRLNSRLIWHAIRYPLVEHLPDATMRMQTACKWIRDEAGISRTDALFVKGSNNTEIERQQFDDKESQRILEMFTRDCSTNLNPLRALIPDDEVREAWLKMFRAYVAGMKIANQNPPLIPGEDGYEGQLERDATELQRQWDLWWYYAKSVIGAAILTNYGHSVKCGNFSRCMRKFGYLLWYRADAVEFTNDDIIQVTHRHTNRFGAVGRGVRIATLAEAIKRWALRKLGYATGIAQRGFQEWDAHSTRVKEAAARKILANHRASRAQSKRRKIHTANRIQENKDRALKVKRDSLTRGGSLIPGILKPF